MKILDKTIEIDELKQIAADKFRDLIKAVADVDKGLIAIDAELQSDLEALFLENGSKQSSLWGINLYPGLKGDGFIEFDSVINIRPSQGNMSRGVDNQEIRQHIIETVQKWIKL